MRTRAWTMAAAVLACASMARAEPVHPGEAQGLGLTGASVPPLLKEVRQDPYAMPASLNCPGVLAQISALDEVLGPDLDMPRTAEAKGGPDVMAGVRSVLPYGGVVRLFTRADHKDRELIQAALAGWERRGFLKGLARNLGCEGFGPPVAAGRPASAVAPAPSDPAPR